MPLWIMLAAAASSGQHGGVLHFLHGKHAAHRPARARPLQKLKPVGNWRGWVNNGDYPAEALRAREQGIARFEIAVNAAGRPRACRVTASTGSPSLDKATCPTLMKRARFRPATDRRARPIPGIYRQAVRWKLANGKAGALVNPSFDARSIVSAGGQVTRCTLSGSSKTLGGGCGPFGDPEFLHYFLRQDFARTRSADVRLIVALDDRPLPPLVRKPDSYRLLAKATLQINPEGRMIGCTSVTKLEALGRTTDLCALVKSDPPRFAPAKMLRRATIQLDLGANYG